MPDKESDKGVDIFQQLVDSNNKSIKDFEDDALAPKGKSFQSDRIYEFNQTGNFLVSSTFGKDDTKDLSHIIPQNCWTVFSQAAVFLAAMTKAMALGTKTKKAKSFYDYDAMRKLIDGSGLWIQMTEEEVHHKSQSTGASFSAELISGLLGLMLPEASVMKFAGTMMQSMGKEAVNINESSQSSQTKLANMIIVCENLFGVPFICMILVNVDSSTAKQVFNVGPCVSGQHYTNTLTMTKQVFYWVSPEAIEKDSKEIVAAMQNRDEAKIVQFLLTLMDGKDPNPPPPTPKPNNKPAQKLMAQGPNPAKAPSPASNPPAPRPRAANEEEKGNESE